MINLALPVFGYPKGVFFYLSGRPEDRPTSFDITWLSKSNCLFLTSLKTAVIRWEQPPDVREFPGDTTKNGDRGRIINIVLSTA